MERALEVKVGVVVVLAMLILAGMIIVMGDYTIFEKGYTIYADFDYVGGIKVGAPVKMAGVEVGKVKDIKVVYTPSAKVRLELRINEGVKICGGATAYIATLGLMGEKYVEISGGSPECPYIPAGTIVQGVGPARFDKMLVAGEKAATNLVELLQKMNEVFSPELKESLVAAAGKLQESGEKLAKLLEGLEKMINDNQDNVQQTLKNVAESAEAIKEAAENIKEITGQNEEKIASMMGDLSKAAENFRKLAEDLYRDPRIILRGRREKPERTIPTRGIDKYKEVKERSG